MNPFEKTPSSTPFNDPSYHFIKKIESFSNPLSQYPIGEEDGESEEQGGERLGAPRPLECLHGVQIPAFLSKTFDLVDDPSLDSIISWDSGGKSFVVWDPVEFSVVILPKNFKHNNFSSFIRQLNTYGFRKIDADKWEFANEGFLRGKRHLLKNIQRRKSSQSHHAGTSSGLSTLDEIERLRKEKSLMMQEVVELQQQQRGTIQHMKAVNEKLQAAEQRQKQMVSFLAKVFQNPKFFARLQQMKEQRRITSPRTMRKFVKHQPCDPVEGPSVKYRLDFQDLATSFGSPDFSPVADQQLPGTGLGEEGMTIKVGSVPSEGLTMAREFLKSPDQAGERGSILSTEDPLFKGKNVARPQVEVKPEYFVSFAEELEEKNISGFPSPRIESMVKEEEVWSPEFEDRYGMLNTSTELWGSLGIYDVPELGISTGLSDVWDIDPLQAAGNFSVDKWLYDE